MNVYIYSMEIILNSTLALLLIRAEQPTRLCKSRRKMRVKIGAPLNRFKPPSNYHWPSQGGTFVAVSICLVLFNF